MPKSQYQLMYQMETPPLSPPTPQTGISSRKNIAHWKSVGPLLITYGKLRFGSSEFLAKKSCFYS